MPDCCELPSPPEIPVPEALPEPAELECFPFTVDRAEPDKTTYIGGAGPYKYSSVDPLLNEEYQGDGSPDLEDARALSTDGSVRATGTPVDSYDLARYGDVVTLVGTVDELQKLNDTNIVTPVSGNILAYDGSKWANKTPTELQIPLATYDSALGCLLLEV